MSDKILFKLANFFLDRAEDEGRNITNMQIQKLVYFTYGWLLAADTGIEIDIEFQAWDYGPVSSVLYKNLKRFEQFYLKGFLTKGGSKISFDNSEDELIIKSFANKIWNRYAHLEGEQMSDLTHKESTPWSKVYEKGVREKVIDKELIKKHYKDLMHDVSKKAA